MIRLRQRMMVPTDNWSKANAKIVFEFNLHRFDYDMVEATSLTAIVGGKKKWFAGMRYPNLQKRPIVNKDQADKWMSYMRTEARKRLSHDFWRYIGAE